MTIHHHVADDLLIAYAAGDLDESWSLVVATHLALCVECRQAVRRAEDLGGVLIEDLEPEAIGNTALQSVLSRIEADGGGKSQPTAAPVHDPSVVLPEPLRSYAKGDFDSLKWRSLGRGAYHIPIEAGDAMVRLLRIPAGKPVPDHGHNGRELTLVLKGSFRDESGHFLRGDVEDCDDSVHHQPIAGDEEDCICLAVTDAPLRFKSLAARLVQPFIGI